MSEQDRFDWNDEDFESLADESQSSADMEPTSQDDESSMISDEEMERELAEVESDSDDWDADEVTDEENPKSETVNFRQAKGISGVGLGFLFGFSILAASLGLGGAMLFALGGNPLVLWEPAGLVQVDQWFNFQDHPLNILYIVGLSAVLLALLGSWSVARAAARANRRLQRSEVLLNRICELRLDNENAWQSPAFKKDAAVAAFASETLGAWRLQQTRQKKYLGLEGELIRLQKAIQANRRADMNGPFETPLVGSLADEAARIFDERERALQESCSVMSKDQHDSESILGIVQDARSWNRQTLDQVGIQGATLDRVATHLDQMKSELDALDQSETGATKADRLQKVRSQLDVWQRSAESGQGAGQLDSLLDRGNKLAFQIAMEVARLGTRGERLLPMTQSLDELNTEMRQISGSLNGSTGGKEDPQWLQLQARLDELAASISQESTGKLQKLSRAAGELSPAAASVSEQLVEIARSFNQQGDRLTKLGEACSELTGVPFDNDAIAQGKADNPPEGGLNIHQFNPFGSEDEPEAMTTEVDPFSTGDISLPAETDFAQSGDFTSSVIPGEDALNITQEAEPTLSSAEEKVYDLAELGAVPIEPDAPLVAENESERIYDLSEFGAVPMP